MLIFVWFYLAAIIHTHTLLPQQRKRQLYASHKLVSTSIYTPHDQCLQLVRYGDAFSFFFCFCFSTLRNTHELFGCSEQNWQCKTDPPFVFFLCSVCDMCISIAIIFCNAMQLMLVIFFVFFLLLLWFLINTNCGNAEYVHRKQV